MKDTIFVATLSLLIMLIVLMVTIFTQPKPIERPFLCVIPYNLEYCAANQDEMYRIQAQRAQ